MTDENNSTSSTNQTARNFAEDVAFLNQHIDTITLSSPTGDAKIVVAPAWQGRVMTSTTGGDAGTSFGWINYDLIQKGVQRPEKREGLEKHIHVFGGIERLWLGSEGGIYSLFFLPGTERFEFEFWKTPDVLDTEAFDLTRQTDTELTFEKSAELINAVGTTLQFKIERTVELLSSEAVQQLTGVAISPTVALIGFRSNNRMTNTGDKAWQLETGTPCIWMLNMQKHGDENVMAIPFRTDGETTVLPINTDYFCELDEQRLIIGDGIGFFKGDGQYRSKIGVPAGNVKPWLGSYNPAQQTLTLVHFNLPENAAELPYLRSQWAPHPEPYSGDVINCYNDGATDPGSPALGPFFELETLSPALALKPAESYAHIQTTMHFTGPESELDAISQRTLGVKIATIRNAFADVS